MGDLLAHFFVQHDNKNHVGQGNLPRNGGEITEKFPIHLRQLNDPSFLTSQAFFSSLFWRAHLFTLGGMTGMFGIWFNFLFFLGDLFGGQSEVSGDLQAMEFIP